MQDSFALCASDQQQFNYFIGLCKRFCKKKGKVCNKMFLGKKGDLPFLEIFANLLKDKILHWHSYSKPSGVRCPTLGIILPLFSGHLPKFCQDGRSPSTCPRLARSVWLDFSGLWLFSRGHLRTCPQANPVCVLRIFASVEGETSESPVWGPDQSQCSTPFYF